MAWPILIVATLSSIFVAIVCFALGLKKLAIVLPAQVVVSFGVAYAVTVGFTGDAGDRGVVWTCLAAAVAIPATWAVLRIILGPPLERRRIARAGARTNG